MSTKTFASAMREFFGFRPGDGLTQFHAELKALSYDDKMYYAQGLRAVGVDCADPATPTA
jgi:hypothetical protein